MIDAETFWTLPRGSKPATLFTEILPQIPPLAGIFTLNVPSSVHVLGSGGGEWSVSIADGVAVVEEGAAADVVTRVSLSRKHLREVVGGALRERGVALMKRLGKPGAFPDLTILPVDPSRLTAVAAIGGSIAIEVHDRDVRDSYRFVVSFGSGPAQYDNATTTVHIDADEVVDQVVAGASISALLKGSRVRVEGDLGLPLRALRAAFGAAALDKGKASR